MEPELRLWAHLDLAGVRPRWHLAQFSCYWPQRDCSMRKCARVCVWGQERAICVTGSWRRWSPPPPLQLRLHLPNKGREQSGGGEGRWTMDLGTIRIHQNLHFQVSGYNGGLTSWVEKFELENKAAFGEYFVSNSWIKFHFFSSQPRQAGMWNVRRVCVLAPPPLSFCWDGAEHTSSQKFSENFSTHIL